VRRLFRSDIRPRLVRRLPAGGRRPPSSLPALIAVILLTAVLAACASLPRPPAPPDAAARWVARQAQLQGLQSWELSGRISVSGPEGSWNARIRWTQRGDAYDIYFMSPFGQRMAWLEGSRFGVMLQLPDKEPLRAATAEELLAANFGWSAPVAALRHWMLGVPQPDSEAATGLDDHGRLLDLRQDGWHIEYPQYMASGAAIGELPRKLVLDGASLRIRLVVDAWDLSGDLDGNPGG
jgi:outer membrane lipoprotein LolB